MTKSQLHRNQLPPKHYQYSSYIYTATMNLEKLSDYITCLQFVFESFSVLALYAFFCICSVSCQLSLNVLSCYFHNNNWKDSIILWPKFSLISLCIQIGYTGIMYPCRGVVTHQFLNSDRGLFCTL